MTKTFFISFAVFALLVGGLLLSKRVWALPLRANAYAADIMAAERTNAMPTNLLARMLWQESRFRPEIIDGSLISPAGAVGIAQIIPRFHPTVDPTNAIASIYYAAGYLAANRRRFGTWPLALSAYNSGPGATNKRLMEHGSDWLDHAPQETQNYVREIVSDVPGIFLANLPEGRI